MADKGDKKEQDQGHMEKLNGAIATANSLTDLLKKFRTESSSTIQSITPNREYTDLFLKVSAHSAKLRRANLHLLLDALTRWHSEVFKVHPELMRVIETALFSEETSKHVFTLNYTNNEGRMFFLSLAFSPCQEDASMIRFNSFEHASSFRLAPERVIVRHSKSNLLSSRTWDEIVYIPRHLSAADTANVWAMGMLPSLSVLGPEIQLRLLGVN